VEFQVEPTAPAIFWAEGRKYIRIRWRGHPVAQFVIRPFFRPRRIIVTDVSVGGLGLFTGHPLQVGSTLALLLRGARPAQQMTYVAEVVHVTRLESGHWLVGCRWVRGPSEEDMRTLAEGESAGE
jgi:hypothetical protein